MPEPAAPVSSGPAAPPVAAPVPAKPVATPPVVDPKATAPADPKVTPPAEPKPEDAATLRQLAAASAKNRELEKQIAALTEKAKTAEESGATAAKKATIADDLQAKFEQYKEMAQSTPWKLLDELGHKKDQAVFDAFIRWYTDEEASSDPRVDELVKWKSDREKADAVAAEARKKADEDKKTQAKTAQQTADETAVKNWAGELTKGEATRWPLLAAEAELRDFVAMRIMREAGEEVDKRLAADPAYQLPDDEAAAMMKSGMDTMEKALRAEFDKLSGAIGPPAIAETASPVVSDRPRGLQSVPKATIDGTAREPLPGVAAKPLLPGGNRQIGMPKRRLG